jgi:DNA-binding response OmpR family regulator
MPSAVPGRPHVVVIEDDAVVAETLTMYLEHAGFGVSVAADGLAGLARARCHDTGVVILDLMIPGLPGHEVCRQLRAESTVPILMLTARTSEDDRIAGLEIGADDYVAKPFSPREVVARVQALVRRAQAGPSRPPEPLRVGGLEVHRWSRQVRMHGRLVPLTATEYRLVEAFAQAPGRTFTREELVARVFGPDFDGFDRTVDTHITNLRRKLEPEREHRYILTVHGVGYRLAAADDLEP